MCKYYALFIQRFLIVCCFQSVILNVIEYVNENIKDETYNQKRTDVKRQQIYNLRQ